MGRLRFVQPTGIARPGPGETAIGDAAQEVQRAIRIDWPMGR